MKHRGDFSPEISSADIDAVLDQPWSATPLAREPNGFVLLGLAPELVQACADLGYTQPTPVQNKVIPLAMLGAGRSSASST